MRGSSTAPEPDPGSSRKGSSEGSFQGSLEGFKSEFQEGLIQACMGVIFAFDGSTKIVFASCIAERVTRQGTVQVSW